MLHGHFETTTPKSGRRFRGFVSPPTTAGRTVAIRSRVLKSLQYQGVTNVTNTFMYELINTSLVAGFSFFWFMCSHYCFGENLIIFETCLFEAG